MRDNLREEEMDRRIQDQLERYLHDLDREDSSPLQAEFQALLAAADEETRNMTQLMEVQARLLRTLRTPAGEAEDLAPAPGFYARVMNRIEEQRPRSIWSCFLEPRFSRRLAFASLSLLVLLMAAFVTSEPAALEAPMQALNADPAPEFILAEPEPTPVTSVSQSEGRDVMLRQLTVYSE
jgi:hypothetical protein